jgi:hypothetical protein
VLVGLQQQAVQQLPYLVGAVVQGDNEGVKHTQ